MFWGLFKKRLSEEEFASCVFEFIKKRLVLSKDIEPELVAINKLLSAKPLPGEIRGRLYAQSYLKIENYIAIKQIRDRMPAEILRAAVARSCKAEQAESDFALLFLTDYLRQIRLFFAFTASILEKTRNFLGEPKLTAIVAAADPNNYLAPAYKKGVIDWRLFEKNMQKLAPEPEKQLIVIQKILAELLTKFLELFNENLGPIRAELIFKETYKEMRHRFDFIEDAAMLLAVAPAGILNEEKIDMLPKTKLAEEVRQRTHQLEKTLSELAEEKTRLAEALANLQAVDKAKSEFITVVSHQFRTPLTAARWNNEMLADELKNLPSDDLKKQLLSYAGVVHDKIVFLVNMLEDIYDVLAIEGKTMRLEYKPSQLWEIVDDLLKELAKEGVLNRVNVVFDRSRAPLREIICDPHKIRRVCAILLRNAAQYSPENGTVKIAIEEQEHDGRPALKCIVQDEGIGIAPDDLTRIFQKFFRGQNAVRKVADGAGLGLYLAKKFIEAHGGVIKVESVLNKGSTFTFILPISPDRL